MAQLRNPHPGEILKHEFLEEIGISQNQLAHAIGSGYATKRAENARRQREGYDGVSSKCGHCKRDLRTTEPLRIVVDGEVVDACQCGTPIPEDAP